MLLLDPATPYPFYIIIYYATIRSCQFQMNSLVNYALLPQTHVDYVFFFYS